MEGAFAGSILAELWCCTREELKRCVVIEGSVLNSAISALGSGFWVLGSGYRVLGWFCVVGFAFWVLGKEINEWGMIWTELEGVCKA